MQITKFFKLRFNSTLVQLKVEDTLITLPTELSFNSTLVQLKVYMDIKAVRNFD